MASDIRIDSICDLPVEKILKLKRDSEYWKEYDESSKCLIEKYKRETYRSNEFKSYRLMVRNLAVYIKRNMKWASPAKICGLLSYLIYSEDSWFYPSKTFKYDDDRETEGMMKEIDELILDTYDYDKELELINKRNDLEATLVSTNDSYLCLGAEVARGRGCCRHLTTFFFDVLFEAGYEVYRVGNSVNYTNGEEVSLIEKINDKYNSRMEVYHASDDISFSDHMCIAVPYKDRYIMFDPTNVLFSVIEGTKAVDINDNYSYVLDIPSVKRYNFFSFDELRLILCRFFESKVGDLTKEELEKEFLLGIEEAKKVKEFTIQRHKDLYNVFEYHSANRIIYKAESELRFLNKMLSRDKN